MQIWIHDNKMKKIVALNNDIPDMLSYTNSSWHSYLDQATSTFDFTIPKFSNGELHEDLKLINDECFVSFYVNGSHQVFYIATLQEDDFNIQLTCNNTNLEYALEYANPFSSESAQTIEWYLNHMDLLSFAAVEIGNNEIPDRKRTLTFDSQETKMNRLQSLMSKFEAEFEFKVELNRDGTYKRIVINIYQEADDTHHGIGTDRKDVVLYYSNGLKGVQVTSDKTQMFNAGVFDGKDGVNLANVEFSEKNADGVEEFYSRKGDIFVYAPLSMQRYPATMRAEGQDNWIRKDFTTEYENVNDLKAYALRTLKKYAYPLVTYTASVQSGFVSHYTDLKLGDTIRIIDKNFVGGLALEARVSEMIISFDNPANNSFVFTNYRKLDNKPSSALQTRIEQAVESKLPYRIELATTGGVTFKNSEGETIVKPSLYKGNLPYTTDVTWRWALDGVVTVGMQYLARAENIDGTAVLTVSAYVGNNEVATTEVTLTNVNDGDDGVGVESIDRYFTSSDQSDGVTIEGAEWSDKPPAPTEDGKYLWAYDEITYTDGTVTTTKPAAVGANFDVDAFRAEIAEDLKDVPNREEFENKIAEELAASKAEITTQIETAKTQAESNAKEYADTINQETAKVAEQANTAADEIKADLVNVKNNLTETSLVANNAQAAVDAAKQDLAAVNTKVDSAKEELTQAKQQLTTVSDDLSKAKTDLQNAVSAVDTKATNLKSDLSQAKQDLTSQAQQLQEQASAQTELSKRVTTVESTANGTKTTVNELSKTVAQNGKDITSVTARTKVVEDDLTSTKTTLSQVKTTADSTSQKTATLETGLNGLSAKFDNLSVGGVNLVKQSTAQKGLRLGISEVLINDDNHMLTDWIKIEPSTVYTLTTYEDVNEANMYYSLAWYSTNNADYSGWISRPTGAASATDLKNGRQYTSPANATYAKVSYPTKYSKVKLERGNIATDYSQNGVDLEQKVAEYKQNADQNYASLSSTVQTLDGQVQSNKTTAEQTAQGFKTRIESLETYKNGESERANAYFESAKTETAKQLTAERTAIANNYVAKSTYTSDVTGIRNELSATTSTANTTKTNLANYQASNDKVVASLKSSLQTTDGNVSNLQTKVEAVPGQITSAVSAVEEKISTSIGGRNLWVQSKATGNFVEETLPDNHVTGQKKCYCIPNYQQLYFNIEPDFSPRLYQKVTFSAWVKYDNVVQGTNSWNKFNCFKHELVRKNSSTGATTGTDSLTLEGFTGTSDWKYITYTYDYAANKSYDQLKTSIKFNLEGAKSGTVWVTGVKVELGSIQSDYTPAPEDTAEQISNLSSEIKQTADGITLLATKTELNTAKSELQSGISTATNKANTAQNTANSNAQTISTHTTQISALNTGLSAKVSQTDFNTLSGRVTTAENNIIAKANELSSKITSVEGKIPTELGAKNLIINSTAKTGTRLPAYAGELQDQAHSLSDWIKIEPNTTYTLTTYENVNEANMYYSLAWYSTNNADYSGWISRPTGALSAADLKGGKQYQAPANAKYAKVSYPTKYAKFKLERGKVSTDYTPAPEDYDSKLATVQSEFKQTTDSIKASVQSLDNSTVKSSSLTINADGIVMKAGKSTTDVANAIGSYFSVNQNAINLFSDKINVKGNMIVNGAITSDKIASKSINTSHLNGKIITADVISSNAVTADAIKAGAVTTDKMSANSINGDRITAGTLDAAKIKAGSITASQIASGTITSAQIKAGTISSANIAAGAITGDKIAAGAIDANKIAANAITANMIRGGQLNSTNGATVFDLNAGTLTFNNNYGYIQRVANDKIFEITTWLHSADADSPEYLTSAFKIRKSDNSRLAGAEFTLYNATTDKPTAQAKINADTLTLSDSQNRTVFSIFTKGAFGNVNFQGWGDIPVAHLTNCGLLVKDIGIGGHTKSLLNIVEELCKKAGILWV